MESLEAATPKDLTGHMMWSDSVLAAIRVSEITGAYSDSSMDFDQIEKAMVKVMPDYGTPVDKDTPQFQIGFAGKILFEIGPGLRKSKQGNVLARFKFQVDNVNKQIYVATYKNNAKVVTNHTRDVISLTIKQATMMATKVMMKIVKVSMSEAEPQYIITPLAGA